jgi:NADH-quinone oxidoreductase subunit A
MEKIKKMFLYNDVYLLLISLIIITIIVNLVIVLLIYVLSIRFDFKHELFSIYECGFLPFHESRLGVESHFLIVALSFIIFDIEIAFIIPWALIHQTLGVLPFFFFICFFILLILGLLFEYSNGLFKNKK